MKIDWMQVFLGFGILVVLFSFWRAHRTPGFDFNAFDIIMENGKVSKLALVFMVSFAVTTWVIINQEITHRLTDGTLGLYLGAWVAPIVAKMFANSPVTSTTTSVSVETKEVTK